MDGGFRRGFTTAEKTELWDRWQRGESLKAIGRAFGKPSSSIYFQVSPHGGIRPAPRRRSRLALTLAEREEISRGIAVHRSCRLMCRIRRARACHCKDEKFELLDDESERYDGDAGAHPGDVRSLAA
jgi:hypothetical protein